MNRLKSLSIFFPCYNDAQIMPYLINNANEVGKKVTKNYEIIVVNDKSTDDSKTILDNLAKVYKKLHIIHHMKNKGYGGALISGLNASEKEWVFYTDGDGQYDVNDLLKLVKTLDDKTEVVNGFKVKRADTVLRTVFGYINNALIQYFFHPPIRDIDCDFRLIKKNALKSIKLDAHSGTICTELIIKLYLNGARFKEVGVNHYKRQFGSSQFFTIRNIIKTVIDTFKLYYKMRSAVSSTGFEPVTTRL